MGDVGIDEIRKAIPEAEKCEVRVRWTQKTGEKDGRPLRDWRGAVGQVWVGGWVGEREERQGGCFQECEEGT